MVLEQPLRVEQLVVLVGLRSRPLLVVVVVVQYAGLGVRVQDSPSQMASVSVTVEERE